MLRLVKMCATVCCMLFHSILYALPHYEIPTLSVTDEIQTTPFSGSTQSIEDNEGTAIVIADDSLWIVDDESESLFEVSISTGTLKRVVSTGELHSAIELGGVLTANHERTGDLESAAYDPIYDHLYVFSGPCCGSVGHIPTVFRLTRQNGRLEVESYSELPSNADYTGAAVHPQTGSIWVSQGKTISNYVYGDSFVSNTTVFNVGGSIMGLGFAPDGADLLMVTSSERLHRVDWQTKQLLPDYNIPIPQVTDSRSVVVVNDEIWVGDGDNDRVGTPHYLSVYKLELRSLADSNSPPLADAGDDQTFNVGAAQMLDGSASSDADGTITTYEWRVAGNPALIGTGATPTLSPALGPGIYTIELTVIDNEFARATDRVRIIVNGGNTGSTTVYEDAEDGQTTGWIIQDNSPSGASITNVFDAQLGSHVIELSGNGAVTANAFLIGGFSGASVWGNTDELILSFRLRSTGSYIINVRLDTNQGTRYIRYRNRDTSGNRVGNTVDIGLGSNTSNNNWFQFTRNLQQDLNAGDPGTTINAVNGMQIRGHLRLDDIALSGAAGSNSPPVADAGANQTYIVGAAQMLDGSASSDPDGIITTYEWRVAGSPTLIGTGETPTLSPALGPGIYTIELTVIDDEFASATDTVTVTVNSVGAGTITIYEDAEDGQTTGWTIQDNNPPGASITNVFDSQLGSHVIELDGNGSETANAFLIGGFSGASVWGNTDELTLSFRLRSTGSYIINVRLNTNQGARYIRYRNRDTSGNRVGNTVDIGLGSNTSSNSWFQFTRNLQQDLNNGDPGTVINTINGMQVRGHLRLDDISLSNP